MQLTATFAASRSRVTKIEKDPKCVITTTLQAGSSPVSHQQCNLQRSVNYQIPVFFHNFHGYDSHLIVHEFPNIQDRKLKVIGQNMEKYLQVQWGPNIVFRDSLQ